MPAPRTRNVLLGLAAVALVLAGFGYWFVFGSATPSFDGKRGVKIPRRATFAQTLDSLETSGVLAGTGRFAALARLTGWGEQIKAGYYEVEAGASPYAVLQKLRRGEQAYVKVTVPPGVTVDRLALVAGRNLEAGADGLRRALTSDSLARVLGVERRDLIGYMLPDTYFFRWLDPPNKVVRRIKESYDAYVQEHGPSPDGLSPKDIATMASIVEWESALDDERPRVAGVYLNRLRTGMPLQADPTVQYAILEQEGQKRRLLFADYRLQHPYNTYLFRGLPPGPLTNPAPSAIRAVLDPEAHEYFYFVAKGDGGHTFSRTLAEHSRAAEAYYALMRERRAAQRAAPASGN